MKNLHQDVMTGVEAILGEAGMLVRDGMAYSSIQFEYARRVAEGFSREEDAGDARTRINMLEAQTGTGKTLGYLVPLMLYAANTGERVMVSTFTRMLQKQILDKDAKLAQRWVAEYCGRKLTVCRRIGRGNYVSVTGCELLLTELERSDSDRNDEMAFLEHLIEWLDAKSANGEHINSGALDDFLFEKGIDELPPGIQRARIMLRPESPEDEQVQYQRDLTQSKAADVLVVNHALLVMHAYRWSQMLDDTTVESGRRTRVMVVDEADRLPDAATTIIGADLTLHGMNALACEVGQLFAEAKDAAHAIATLHDSVQAMLRVSDKDKRVTAILVGDAKSAELAKNVAYANNATQAVSSKLVKLLENSRGDNKAASENMAKLARFVDMANDLALFAAAMQSHDNTAVVSWSPVLEYPSLRVGKPNPGRVLSRLWRDDVTRQGKNDNIFGHEALPEPEQIKAILFTSATLSVPGKPLPVAFDDFASSIGVLRFPRNGQDTPLHRVQLDLYAQFAPDRFGSLQFVLADPRVPNPSIHAEDTTATDDRLWRSNTEWLDYAAHVIEQAWTSGSRVLALTLSRADTNAIAERLLARPLAENVLIHREGETLSTLRKRYVGNERAILLTPGGWEGLDMPGMVSNLVITRIPFAPMDGSESEILRAHLFAQGMARDRVEMVVKARITHAARRKLAQGIGRAIRARDDVATVWIADPRFPMPESMSCSLDPIIMEATPRKIQHMMLSCIPERFLDGAFLKAQLCVRDGGLHRPC
jgi:ATP-dependent DNA helicase DinG